MNQQTKTGPGPPETAKIRESLLMETGRALRAISMYPAGHPQRVNLVKQTYSGVQSMLAAMGDASYKVTREGFSFNDEGIGSSQGVIKELAQEMHLRQVTSFSLKKELTIHDFISLLEMLLENPEKFRRGKYIEYWIKSRHIRTVWLNEIDFTSLSALAGSEEEGESDQEATEFQARLKDLLQILDNETDLEKFTQILRELEAMAQPLYKAKDFEQLWRITATISSHATEEVRPGPGGEPFRPLALRTVRALCKGAFLSYLLQWYAGASEQYLDVLRRVFSQVGLPAVEEAMNILATKEAMTAFRPLLGLVCEFGPGARGIIEAQLGKPEPVRLRKALYLLGDLGMRESVESIKPFIVHRDSKVKREAIRSLSRIKAIESSRALTTALQRVSDPDTRSMIVLSLGESRDPAAVPALVKLLKKQPLREDTVALLEATVDALGRIGSKEALPHVIGVLNQRSLFNRELCMRLRVKAAQALGRLGGESAIQALARYTRGGDDSLKRTATAVMEALLENDGRPVERIEELLK